MADRRTLTPNEQWVADRIEAALKRLGERPTKDEIKAAVIVEMAAIEEELTAPEPPLKIEIDPNDRTILRLTLPAAFARRLGLVEPGAGG